MVWHCGFNLQQPSSLIMTYSMYTPGSIYLFMSPKTSLLLLCTNLFTQDSSCSVFRCSNGSVSQCTHSNPLPSPYYLHRCWPRMGTPGYGDVYLLGSALQEKYHPATVFETINPLRKRKKTFREFPSHTEKLSTCVRHKRTFLSFSSRDT